MYRYGAYPLQWLQFGVSGFGLQLTQGGGQAFVPEAIALFARFTTPPTPTRKVLINNLIVALINAGVWAKLDALYVMAAADNQAARRNWIADQFNLTAVSAPTFVADRGYNGDGSTSYLNPSFNPATAVTPKFVQNDAHMGIWSRTDLLNASAVSWEIGFLGQSAIAKNTVAGRASGRPNAGSLTIASGAFPGQALWARSTAALWEGYANGVDGGGGTDASLSPGNGAFLICAVGGGFFGVNQLSAAHWGQNLTAAEVAALYAALNTYLTAVGAA